MTSGPQVPGGTVTKDQFNDLSRQSAQTSLVPWARLHRQDLVDVTGLSLFGLCKCAIRLGLLRRTSFGWRHGLRGCWNFLAIPIEGK